MKFNVRKLKVLILDNYDSFTWNLAHLVEQFTEDFEVYRNDQISAEDAVTYEKILLSPGPGLPADAGIMPELIALAAGQCSILGVCLGMQGIVEHYGGSLVNLSEVHHGEKGQVEVVDDKDPLLKGLDSPFEAGLYYSWAIEEKELPADLKITARSQSGDIMALSHRELDVKGVQFHPESIMTSVGKKIIENWLTY